MWYYTDRRTTVLIIFDKDNTLIAPCNGRPANTVAEQRLLPGVVEKCAELREQGHVLAIASNQGGVAFGYLTQLEAQVLVRHAARLIGAADWEMCPHHPGGTITPYTQACTCRKPAPGMLHTLMRRLRYTPRNTIYIGDQDTDRQAAQAAGCRFIWASEFFK